MAKSHKSTKRNAAYMLVNGCTENTIITQLKIRYSTLRRWRTEQEFAMLIERYKRQMEQRIEFQMFDLVENLVVKAAHDYRNSSGNTATNLERLLKSLQVLKALPNTPQTLPQSPQKRTKSAKNTPKPAEIPPKSTLAETGESNAIQ